MNPMNMIGQMMGKGGGMNPFQMVQMLQQAKGNPMQIFENMASGNPQYQRVMQMVNGKSPQEIRKVCMNLCEQQGVDFSGMVNQMKSMGINVPEYDD